MKYANILYNGSTTFGDVGGNKLLNVGDQLQLIAIDTVYEKMGISPNEILYIDYDDLASYNGEYALLPINFFFPYKKYISDVGIGFSNKIIPVFIGMATSSTKLSSTCLEMFRTSSPIGCRDQFTLNVLRKYNIPSYLGGCITLVIEERKTAPVNGKVFFVDAPASILPFIPNSVKNNAVYMSHLYYGNPRDLYGGDLKQWVQNIIEQYVDNAGMIVTSRFHAATLGLALGIPTILVLNNMMPKYTWLKKIIPIYTESEFHSIDWNVDKANIAELKSEVLSIAIKRIEETYNKTANFISLSSKLEIPESLNEIYSNFSYEQAACEYIRNNWDTESEKKYILWGLGKTAYNLYDFIDSNYPNAVLSGVYDMANINFHGLQAQDPNTIEEQGDVFCFVTSSQASYSAEHYFKTIGKPETQYFLCRNQFLTQQIVEENHIC